MDFRVMSDSSCDISQEQEKAYGINLISYYVSFDGVNYKKDRAEVSAEDFYREMAENPGVYPKTSMPTQVDFYEAFLPCAKKGEKVIYLNLTSKFSSSFQSARLAAEALMEDYPDCKIAVIDSFSATVQEGLLVTEAARMAQDGISFEEAVERLKYFGIKPWCSSAFQAEKSSQEIGGQRKRLLTERDVQLLAKEGHKVLVVEPGTVVTPLAKDVLKEYGISMDIKSGGRGYANS